MLFSEIYGTYFNAVAAILSEACEGALTKRRLNALIARHAFAESGLQLGSALQDGTWSLLLPDGSTPIRRPPSMPPTTLQKRWLKALLQDPRIALFGVSAQGLEGVEPLYTQDMVVFFDQYADGDPYTDPQYRAHFQTILSALHTGRRLALTFQNRRGQERQVVCTPRRLEYSAKDDKFRLLSTAAASRSGFILNVARIRRIELQAPCVMSSPAPARRKAEVSLELSDARNALERAMLHFSDLEKQTERLDGNRYRIQLRYDRDDETELLIRVLSFGPLLRVTAPESFIEQIRQRLRNQKSCGLNL